MADIKRLLSKKGWTGRELGILELTNMCAIFRQAVEGKDPRPIVEQTQLRMMINAITDGQQRQIYNGYISIHEWISVQYNIAQTHLQQAQLRYRELYDYITDAIFAEDVYSYIERLPVIMSKKQFEDAKAEGIEAQLKGKDGEDLYCTVFDLIERAITYYSRQLQEHPGKPNPLKAIRKKYVRQPIKSKVILSQWNEVQGEGYYTIEDGSGRRSDAMTAEEWAEAIITPAMMEALGDSDTRAKIVAKRNITRAKALFDGGTEKDADEAQHKTDYELGLATPVKWHYYEDPPADLMKWDVIEQELLQDFYPADIDGSGDKYSEENFTRSMEDFISEFDELVASIVKVIDELHFDSVTRLDQIPVGRWWSTRWSRRKLYEIDFFGERGDLDADASAFDGNKRALFNGIAILRTAGFGQCIDERGYYVAPDIYHTLSNLTLEAFFPEADDYAETIDSVETARHTLIESYYRLKGYNLSLSLIAKHYDVPDLTIFQMDVAGVEDKIRAFNDGVLFLYKKIADTDYADNSLKEKKLQVLKDFFYPIECDSITIPAENIREAEALLKDFAAFAPENASRFDSLLCVLPEEPFGGEEC